MEQIFLFHLVTIMIKISRKSYKNHIVSPGAMCPYIPAYLSIFMNSCSFHGFIFSGYANNKLGKLYSKDWILQFSALINKPLAFKKLPLIGFTSKDVLKVDKKYLMLDILSSSCKRTLHFVLWKKEGLRFIESKNLKNHKTP
jgi:hypothetical protein